MTEPQHLGDFIRERRLALGFSAGQLAMRLGITAAVVRSWERGHGRVPDVSIPGLARLLDVPESHLRELQPEIDDEAVESDGDLVRVDRGDESESVSAAATSDATAAGDDGEDAASPDEGADAVGDDAGPSAIPAGTPLATRLAVDTGLLEAPTEAIEPVRVLRRSATATTPPRRQSGPEPAGAVGAYVEPDATEVDGSVPAVLGVLRVFFDPEKPYLYWARWAGTIVGLYLLLRFLGFALDGLVEAVGDFWDSFRTPDGPSTENIVVSLGFFATARSVPATPLQPPRRAPGSVSGSGPLRSDG